MTSEIEREPDELWTHYLTRRLQAEGIELGEPRIEGSYITRNTPDAVIAINWGLRKLVDAIPSLTTYSDLQSLDTLLTEEAEVGESLQCKIVFSQDGTATFMPYDEAIKSEGIFEKYEPGKQYPAQQVIDDLVEYAKDQLSGIEENLEGAEIEPASIERSEIPRPETTLSPGESLKIDEILAKVKDTNRQLRDLRIGDPGMRNEGDNNYYPRLYGESVNKGNLKWFNYDGESIFYVLVHSSQIEGKPGVPFENLYFVAEDFAPEDWQQNIIAVHESLCVKKSHEYARSQEPAVAKSLGKEKEYQAWRATIPDKDCKLTKDLNNNS